MQQVKLISKRLCPYCERVEIGIRIREISTQQIQKIFPDEGIFPTEITRINPQKTFPTLLMDDEKDGFAESLVILQYIDTLHSTGRKIYGDDAFEKAKVLFSLETNIQKINQKIATAVFSFGDENKITEAINSAKEAFSLLENILEQRKTSFLGGDNLNAEDIYFIPFLLKYYSMCLIDTRFPIPSNSSKCHNYLFSVINHQAIKGYLPTFEEMSSHILRHNEKKRKLNSNEKLTKVKLYKWPHQYDATESLVKSEMEKFGFTVYDLQTIPGWFNRDAHSHDYDEIRGAVSGCTTFHFDDLIITIEPGDIIVIPAHTIHKVITHNSRPFIGFKGNTKGKRSVTEHGND